MITSQEHQYRCLYLSIKLVNYIEFRAYLSIKVGKWLRHRVIHTF